MLCPIKNCSLEAAEGIVQYEYLCKLLKNEGSICHQVNQNWLPSRDLYTNFLRHVCPSSSESINIINMKGNEQIAGSFHII